MAENGSKSVLASILTVAGAVLAVFSVIALRIGLKATISPGNQQVTLLKGAVSVGALVVFGISAGLILAGSRIGRRNRLRNEGRQNAAAPELQSPGSNDELGRLPAENDRERSIDRSGYQ